MFKIIIMMMMMVVVMMWMVITPGTEQWFSFFVSSDSLSYKENSLLYEQDQEEPKADDELRDGELHVQVVFCFNLRQNLNRNLQLKIIIVFDAHLSKELLGFWNQI